MPPERIAIGDPAPTFALPDETGTEWSLLDNDIAGRPLLLLFGEPGPAFAAAVAAFAAAQPELARLGCTVFAITRAGCAEGSPIAHLTDASGRLFKAYDVGAPPHTTAVVISPSARVAYIGGAATPGEVAAVLAEIRRLVDAGWADMLASHPPVLLVPMALSREDCACLIRVWRDLDARHGRSGHSNVRADCVSFVREYGRVQQYHIEEARLRDALDAKIAPRIMPEIAKAFDSRVTKREALVISRYDSAEGGMLRPHRDCASPETAHRRFSVTLALNDEFVGGEMKFCEYGDRLYRLPVGTALVFACALMHEVLPVTAGNRFALVTHLW